MLQVLFPPSYPNTVKRNKKMLFGATKKGKKLSSAFLVHSFFASNPSFRKISVKIFISLSRKSFVIFYTRNNIMLHHNVYIIVHHVSLLSENLQRATNQNQCYILILTKEWFFKFFLIIKKNYLISILTNTYFLKAGQQTIWGGGVWRYKKARWVPHPNGSCSHVLRTF
jgi:hypothetical protein